MENNAKIKEMCKNIGLSIGKTSDEYLFTLQAVDLFYYHGNIGQVDIKMGFTDGKGDGGIDFIYCDDETMYLVQGKSSESLGVEAILNVFTKIAKTVGDFSNKKYDDYSSKLKQVYLL